MEYFEYNGLRLDESNDFLDFTVEGVEELPALDDLSVERPFSPGAWQGLQRPQTRVITLEGQIVPPTAVGQMTTKARSLLEQHLISGVDSDLIVKNDIGIWLFKNARVTRRKIVTASSYYRNTEFIVEFKCADPRKYNAVGKEIILDLSTDQDGLLYDFLYPDFYVKPDGRGGYGSVTNSGNTATAPTIRLQGILRNPVLSLAKPDGTKVELTVSAYLQFGEIIIDASTGRATSNGADCTHLVKGNISDFTFPPGESSIQLTSSMADISKQYRGKAIVDYADAYL